MKAITLTNPNMFPVLTPDSGVTHCRNPYFLPEGTWWPLTLVGVRIDRLGMRIAEKFARRYYSEVLTAVHPENIPPLETKPFEWMRDGALIISDSVPSLEIAPEILDHFDRAVAFVSNFMTLKTGDLIFLPTFGEKASKAVTLIPLYQKADITIDTVPDGFPSFTLKVR